MTKFRKIISLTILVLSIFFFIISLAGIPTTWILNQNLTEMALSEIEIARSDLQDAKTRLTLVDEDLTLLGNQIVIFQGVLDSVGDNAIESTQVVADVVTGVEEKISPILSGAESSVDTIYEAFTSIKDTLEELNNIPFIDITVPGGETLETILENMESLQDQIQTTQDDITNIAKTTEELITTLRTNFENWEKFVNENLDELSGYQERIDAYDNRLANLEENLPNWLLISSISITIILFWTALSQIGLFILAWSFYKEQDLLERWR